MNTAQLKRIADVSDEYATGNLHLTTRQDVQLHYVKLEDSPKLWGKLEAANKLGSKHPLVMVVEFRVFPTVF